MPIALGIALAVPKLQVAGSGAAPGIGYIRDIVIQSSLVSGSLSEFPTLLYFNDPTFATVANGGHMESADADDFLLWFESSQLTSPFWEIEDYNPVTGELWIWTGLDIDDVADLTIYCTYGDPGISGFQSVAADVWDATHRVVQHYTASLTADSTANGNNATNLGTTAVAGWISSAAFAAGSGSSGSGQSQTVGFNPNGLSQLALSFWFKWEPGNIGGQFYHVADSNPFYQASGIAIYSGGSSTGSLTFQVGNGAGRGTSVGIGAGGTAWEKIRCEYTGSALNIYQNGVLTGSSAMSGNVSADNPRLFREGFYGYSGIGSTIDEFVLGDTAKGADWAETEYNNQFDPAAFAVVGAEAPL